jgi:hypothetical protein
MSSTEKTHEQAKQPRPHHADTQPAENHAPDERKLHWWSACPCHSGLRFGKCCGSDGSETCRYEST